MQRIANIFGATGGNHAGWIYDKCEDAPSINTGQGGYRQPMIIEVRRSEDSKRTRHKTV